MILQVLIAMVAGWINRHQQLIIAYQQEEIGILKTKLGKRRIRFTDTERRRLAMLAHPLDSWCRACGLATTESEFNCLL